MKALIRFIFNQTNKAEWSIFGHQNQGKKYRVFFCDPPKKQFYNRDREMDS